MTWPIDYTLKVDYRPPTSEEVDLLAKKMKKHRNPPCLLVIHQTYSTRKRVVFRVLGPSREEDYKTFIEEKTALLLWVAKEPMYLDPKGILVIPATQYVRYQSRAHPAFFRTLFFSDNMEYNDGPVLHPLLRNCPQKEVAPTLPPFENPFSPHWEGTRPNSDLSFTFYIGKEQVIPYLFHTEDILDDHPLSTDFLVSWVMACQYLGIRLPKEILTQARICLEEMKKNLRSSISEKAWTGKTEEAKKLAEEYFRKFGEKIESITIYF